MMRRQRTARRATYGWGAIVLIAVAAAPASRARADDVWVGKPGRKPLKYSGVRVRGDEGGELVFQTRTGNEVSKPIEQIARLHLNGEDALNEAEELFADRDYADAIVPYERVRTRTERGWLKRYVTARLVTCYDADGRLVDAVKAWIETLEVWPTHGISLQPRKVGRKGSRANARSLDTIRAALAADLTPETTRAIKRLQRAIWRVEQDPRGDAVEPIGPTRPDRQTRAAGRTREVRPDAAERPAGTTDISEARAKANSLAEEGRYDEAVSEINRLLPAIPERSRKRYFPRLLAFKATCLMARGDALGEANQTDPARRAYLHAGLAAMHVIAFFPDSPPFIECLYLVAGCHEKIGRTQQAIALYQECREFAIGRKQPKWKNQSTEALKRLDVKLE